MDSSHPAALLGAAEVLAASASLHISIGVLGALAHDGCRDWGTRPDEKQDCCGWKAHVLEGPLEGPPLCAGFALWRADWQPPYVCPAGMAAAELAQAAQYASRCAAGHGTLQTAWKQLGDVLILHHSVTPAPSLRPLPAPTGSLAQLTDPHLVSWAGRIRATQAARRAYSRALHLNPAEGGAWLDVASTHYHEGQLRRAHEVLGMPPGISLQLSQAAERLLRGGLRMEPASPELWAALGTSAADPGVREYALSRALQLEPKSVPAWVALARLYTDHGQAALAWQCLQQARNNDPAQAAIWEAMSALAALSPAGSSERAEFAEHAITLLGVGPEGLLTFAEAAIRSVSGCCQSALQLNKLCCCQSRMLPVAAPASPPAYCHHWPPRAPGPGRPMLAPLHCAGPGAGGGRLCRGQAPAGTAATQPSHTQCDGPGL